MPRVVVIEKPDPVLSLAEAKAHLRVSGDGDDALITGLIAAVTASIDGPDGWIGRALGQQVLEWRGHCFPARYEDCVELPCVPIGAIVSVTYDDPAGAAQTVAPEDYELHGSCVFARRGFSWPAVSGRPDCVRIRYQAGYATEDLPPAIVPSLKLMLADFYAVPAGGGTIKKEVVEGVGSTEWDTAIPFDATSNRAVTLLLTPLRVWS